MNDQTSLIKTGFVLAGILGALTAVGQTQDAAITVQADQVLHLNSPYLTGACIEDVNHEIYGGIDSQMIFGESFAEPATPLGKGSGQGVGGEVSGMWNAIQRGTAAGTYSVERQNAFSGDE